MLTEGVKSRLYNWKFEQAWRRLTSGDDASTPTPEEAELVEALSDMLGDPGWFDGNLATVIRHALAPIVDDD